MNTALLDPIVNAVLYEGYMLYPYRGSSRKNQRERFTFGRVYPRAYSQLHKGVEPSLMQTECLLHRGSDDGAVEISIRFLQPMSREIGVLAAPICDWPRDAEPPLRTVPELQVNGAVYRTWQEAIEREVKLPIMPLEASTARTVEFGFEPEHSVEPLRDEQNQIVACLVRHTEAIAGCVESEITNLADGLSKLTVRIKNESYCSEADLNTPDAVLARTFASTHIILNSHRAEFVSLLDPPAKFKAQAAGCKNLGGWPVLVGDHAKAERDTMLCSPIILYDYPRIAPESCGDLFDGTEIDELLLLRIMTMTEEEKREMGSLDAHARRLLERTQTLTNGDLLQMHGTLRDMRSFDEQIFGSNTPLQRVPWHDVELSRGSRVRIRPKHRADVMDLALAGRTAVVEAVEQDAEHQIHLALVLDDDPGRDLGMVRQPGHRFFYRLDEVEPVREGEGA